MPYARGGAREEKAQVCGASHEVKASHNANIFALVCSGNAMVMAGAVSASVAASNNAQECDLSPSYSLTAAEEFCCATCAEEEIPAQFACAIRCCIPIHCANSTTAISSAMR